MQKLGVREVGQLEGLSGQKVGILVELARPKPSPPYRCSHRTKPGIQYSNALSILLGLVVPLVAGGLPGEGPYFRFTESDKRPSWNKTQVG